MLAVGRVGGFAECSAAAIDVGGDDQAPAYVLTAGHCTGMAQPNEALIGLSAESLGQFRVNGFWDTVNSLPIEFPIAAVEYSTMHTTDVAIVRLDATVGDLRNRGIRPFPIADGMPPLASPITVVGHPLNGVMLRSRCNQGKPTRVLEGEFLMADTANDCAGVTFGSSGSPVFDAAGQIFGVISTGSGTPIVDGNVTRWNATIQDEGLPYYRFKAGPAASTFCEVDVNYGQVMSVSSNPIITDEVTPVEGIQVLCVHGGTGTDISTTFTRTNSATATVAIIDDTPPPTPLPVTFVPQNDATMPGISYKFDFSYRDEAKYYYRLQIAGASDCQRLPNDNVVAADSEQQDSTVVQFSIPTQPSELCVTAEDSAGNLSEPQVIPIDQPSAN